MGPVAAERVGVELVAAALEAAAQEVVLDIALAVADGEVRAGMIARAVLVFAAVDVEPGLEGEEVVVVLRAGAEDAIALALTVVGEDAAPDAVRRNPG